MFITSFRLNLEHIGVDTALSVFTLQRVIFIIYFHYIIYNIYSYFHYIIIHFYEGQ